MPYIHKSDRYRWDDPLIPRHAGELNFAITTLCNKYLRANSLSYGEINTIIGVLECAKQEFYRRIAVPYENIKIKENGDVY